MKLGNSYRSLLVTSTLAASSGMLSPGCKADQLTMHGADVVLLYSEPVGCENLGVVVGRGGGLSGAYSKPSINEESAENDARNKAAELGGTHLMLHAEEIAQGDGHAPDSRDTAPAMAHGSGTGSTVTMSGTAYKCALGARPPTTVMAIDRGTAIVAVQAPTSISLAPLGALERMTVFGRTPLPSGGGMQETELSVVEDPAEIDAVVQSLNRVALDPMKYVPTHRIQVTGELGVQSLLYGFGYLQYAGETYRLTDGDFETVLKLRAEPTVPEVEAEAAPSEP